ncbi:comec/rec2-related protein [Flammeovirgaceae bacterium 311]|nr:comec/rec2-related protein [Flammeovirgaceae bacterium 311]
MQHWLAFPWVRYVCWLTLGVVAAFYMPGWSMPALWFSFTAAVIFMLSAFFLKQNNSFEQLFWGFGAFCMLLGFGYWRTSLAVQVAVPANPDAVHWLAEVEDEPVPTQKSYRFRARIREASGATDGVIALVYIPRNQLTQAPGPGQLLLLKGTVQEVPPPLNPGEFNYQAYLASLGVHHQLFSTAVQQASRQTGPFEWVKQTALGSRRYLLQVVQRLVADREAAGVVSAMVLGHRAALDRSLRQAYADAGVMHVLAVSGLHVGIVYGFLLLLFSRFQKKKWQRWGWLVLCLLVLWLYAWLTGLAPSAMRAALMFSIIALGKASKLKGNIYNSIGLSAFLLLAFNPLLIKQVGFQLSYAAVIGIVYLQPRISRWYQPKEGLYNKVWQLFTVTLAAQLATFPLGLYYFHQFPTYFFISNLLAVPLAFLILAITLLLLLLHWVPWIGVLLGVLVKWLTLGLNQWVQLTEQLPSSRLVALVQSHDVVLMYASIICLLVLARRRSFFWVGVNFSLLILLGVSGFYRTHQLRNQRQILFYQIPGHTLLQFVHGQKEYILPIGELPNEQQLEFHVEPSRIMAGVKPVPVHEQLPQDFPLAVSNLSGVQLVVWHGFTIAVVEGKEHLMLPSQPVQVDVLLLRQNPKAELEMLQQTFRFKYLVLDASNNRWYRQQLSVKANSLDLPFYNTSDTGALIVQL